MRMAFILAGIGVAAWVWFKQQAEQNDREHTEKRGTYRPGSASGEGVRFGDAGADQGAEHSKGQVPRDAFTGEDLDVDRMIYQCQACRAWYHGDTVRSLNHDHHGRCVMCGESDLLRDRITEDRITAAKS